MKRDIEKVDSKVFTGKNYYSGSLLFKNNLPIFINKALNDKPPDLQVHMHDFIEIVYVYSGKGTHQIANEVFDVSKGDLFFINPNVPHRFTGDSSYGIDEFLVYNFDFSVNLINETNIRVGQQIQMDDFFLYNALLDKNNQIPYYHIQLHGNTLNDVESIYEKAHNEFNNHNIGYENVLFSYLMLLLVIVFRAITGNHDTTDSKKYKVEIMENAIQYINENFTDANLSLQSVANQFFLSKNYFAHLFKETTGENFSKYVQNKRISHACKLLSSSDYKIIEIIEQCGYHDVKYFNELFKQIVGKTPREYRKCSRNIS